MTSKEKEPPDGTSSQSTHHSLHGHHHMSLKGVTKSIIAVEKMEHHAIDATKARKPRFVITAEGEFLTNIVHDRTSTSSSIMGRLLGRSNQHSEGLGTFCLSTEVANSGPLIKQGSWWHSWKERFFVLRKDVPVLAYYNSDSPSDLLSVLGSIFLTEHTVVKKVKPQDANSYEHAFSVHTPAFEREDGDGIHRKKYKVEERTLLVRAPNEDDLEKWISKIEKRAAESSAQDLSHVNAEINWWDLLFKDRQMEPSSDLKSRKGTRVPSNNSAETQKPSEVPYSDTQNPNANDGHFAPRDIDSDYTSSSDSDNGEGIEKTTGGLRRESARSKQEKDRYVRYYTKKKKKEKITKPLPNPLDFDVDKFITTYESYDKYLTARGIKSTNVAATAMATVAASQVAAIEGIQICLELKNICFESDKVFVTLYALDEQGKRIKIGKTETVQAQESDGYALSLPKSTMHFSVMQESIREKYQDLFFCVSKEEYNRDGSDENLQHNDDFCEVHFSRDIFVKNTVFCSEMVINQSRQQVDLTNPQIVKPEVKIGIVRLSSIELLKARLSIERAFQCKPYSERFYSFKATNGVMPSIEQIYVSPYSLLASKSFLKMVFRERKEVLAAWRDDAEKHIMHANTSTSEFSDDALGSVEFLDITRLRIEEQLQNIHDDHLCDPQDIQDFYRTILKVGDETILKVGDEHVDKLDVINNVVPRKYGGCYLRRSTWKKMPLWQYATTNLNVQILTTKVISDTELIEGYEFNDFAKRERESEHKMQHQHQEGGADVPRIPANVCTSHFSEFLSLKNGNLEFDWNGVDYNESADSRKEKKMEETGHKYDEALEGEIHFIPVITLGVPAAHALRFDKGGLRKLLKGIPSTRWSEWMHALQCPNIDQVLELRKKYPDDAAFLFDKFGTDNDFQSKFRVFEKKYKLAKRLDICSSQVLGFACALVRTIVSLAALQPRSIYAETLRVSLKVGWLIPIQSLLSTYKDEMGMIEDMNGAFVWLQGTHMRFVDASQPTGDCAKEAKTSDFVVGTQMWRTESGKFVVDLELSDPREVEVVKDAVSFWVRENAWNTQNHKGSLNTQHEKDKSEQLESDDLVVHDELLNEASSRMPPLAAFKLCGVAFTMGINEMQTFANHTTRMFSTSVKCQAEINRESFATLDNYYRKHYRKYWQRMYNYQGLRHYGEKTIERTDELLDECRLAVEACSRYPDKKNASVPTTVAFICRKLAGTIGITCKSGKDRTSMGSTLELARACVDIHNCIDGEEMVRTLRSHGCRRMNVWGNTGQSMYAFNSMQRGVLPLCYRPPEGTFSGSVNT